MTLIARGQRLTNLRTHGLVLEDADLGQRTEISLPILAERCQTTTTTWCWCRSAREQFAGTLPIITGVGDGSDVLMFGNATGSTPKWPTVWRMRREPR